MAGDNLEYDTLTSHPGIGFPADMPMPFGAWRLFSGLDITGITTPNLAALSTDLMLLNWADNAADTVRVAYSFEMPLDYCPNPVYPGRAATGVTATPYAIDTAAKNQDFLKFYAIARRSRGAADATGTANTLTPVAQVHWFTPGTDIVIRSLTTGAVGEQASAATGLGNGSAYLPFISASNEDATTNLTGFAPMVMDIGARLRAEGKRILPGDVVRIVLGVNAQYADAQMQVIATRLRYWRNACFNDVRQRGINI